MPDYRLDGLSSRSFEQLVQALAQKHLGPRTLIFGDGPDGAREASYNGKCKVPPLNEEWNGHLIVQAKFLQKPGIHPKDNSDWLIAQIAMEMKKFTRENGRAKGRIKAPDYYVIASNVRNSGIAGKGGKDRLKAQLDGYAASLGLKGWILWDESEINRLLDDASEIRRTYSAWITPGDVLAEMLSLLEKDTKEFELAVMTQLQEDFCNAQFAKLRQAGHGSEDKTQLSKLFVDLPVSKVQFIEPPEEGDNDASIEENTNPKVDMILLELIKRGDAKLNSSSLSENDVLAGDELFEAWPIDVMGRFYVNNNKTLKDEREKVMERLLRSNAGSQITIQQFHDQFEGQLLKSKKTDSRMVLLGGPGQGKTTIGQFACQLYRASLLADCGQPLMPETQDALSAFKSQCGSEIPRPNARRYPIWIDLKELAGWLATLPITTANPSLLRFLSNRLGDSVKDGKLGDWMKIYPWFVVFDGLDEVSPSSGRDRMLKCIQRFISEATTKDCDILVLCTTRPQGYSRDFDSRYYDHLWLTPLSSKRALEYGNKVLDSRHGKTSDDRRAFGARLKEAADGEITSRVMRSPLQVTIMTSLVERVGKPPEQRWMLFREYYSVIYERERERGTEWSEALGRYHSEVDSIHRRGGWRLQVRSEAAKTSDARLPASEFELEVSSELAREGHAAGELDQLVKVLGKAATERLVFLVALGSDEVGFEIRSLQEFMAADHLFKAGDQSVCRGLSRMAVCAYWKNVFLFVAGRIFAERRHLRDVLLGALAHLNEDATRLSAKMTLVGSMLALDILEDGSARHIPISRDALLRIACRLLDVALPRDHQRLAIVGMRNNESIFREELCQRLSGGDGEARRSAFYCVSSINADHGEWPSRLVEDFLPSIGGDFFGYISDCNSLGISINDSELVRMSIRNMSPFGILGAFGLRFLEVAKGLEEFIWMVIALRAAAASTKLFNGSESLRLGFVAHKLEWRGAGRDISIPDDLSAYNPDWKIAALDLEFSAKPSLDSLADILDEIRSHWTFPLERSKFENLSWPIAFILSSCVSIEDVIAAAASVRGGLHGSCDEWMELESSVLPSELQLDEVVRVFEGKIDDSLRSRLSAVDFDVKALISFWGNCATFSEPTSGKSGAGSVSVSPLLSVINSKNPIWSARFIESLSFSNSPPHFSVESFVEAAALSQSKQLPVSSAWLVRMILYQAPSGSLPERFDVLGNSILKVQGLYSAEAADETKKAMDFLIRSIARNPLRFALWRILALMPLVPDPKIYSRIIEQFPEPRNPIEDAVEVSLMISGRGWTADSAASIATRVNGAFSVLPDFPVRLAHIFRYSFSDDLAAEALAAAVLEHVPQTHWRLRMMLREALRDFHLRRTSDLSEQLEFD
jgi:hypothetical protein